MKASEKANLITRGLKKLYPDAFCALHYKTPFQLLVATILSAQCTDVRVNLVTPHLFDRFPDPQSMSQASLLEIEALIRTTGFYRNKAKSILQTSQDLCAKHHGEVPQRLEDLIELRGVGRKTANVVLGEAFNIQVGVVVDTHVGRLSRRLGLSKSENPVKIEQDLMKLIPQKNWTIFSHWMISHGRALCTARKPKCDRCDLLKFCSFGEKQSRKAA